MTLGISSKENKVKELTQRGHNINWIILNYIL